MYNFAVKMRAIMMVWGLTQCWAHSRRSMVVECINKPRPLGILLNLPTVNSLSLKMWVIKPTSQECRETHMN